MRNITHVYAQKNAKFDSSPAVTQREWWLWRHGGSCLHSGCDGNQSGLCLWWVQGIVWLLKGGCNHLQSPNGEREVTRVPCVLQGDRYCRSAENT